MLDVPEDDIDTYGYHGLGKKYVTDVVSRQLTRARSNKRDNNAMIQMMWSRQIYDEKTKLRENINNRKKNVLRRFQILMYLFGNILRAMFQYLYL